MQRFSLLIYLKQKLANGQPRSNVQQLDRGGAKQAPKSKGLHTLLLKQETTAASSKTWSDYATLNEAIDAVTAAQWSTLASQAQLRVC